MTNKENLETFSGNLQYLINKSGKQQKDIAIDLDIPVQTLNNWVKGKAMPRWGTIQKLAEYFDVPTTDLVIPYTMTLIHEASVRINLKKSVDAEIQKMDDSQLKRLLAYAQLLNSNPEA